MDGDDNDAIAKQITKQGTELTIVGVDFDDPASGYKEEDKESYKKYNEDVLKDLASKCEGKVFTISKALADLEIPFIKNVRSVATYKGKLTLGDTDKYESASIAIDVERYPCVMIARAASAKQVVIRSGGGDGMDLDETQETGTVRDDEADENGLTSVRRARAFAVQNAEAPGGKIDVDKAELERGFEYGRTVVQIADTESNVMKLENEIGLQIVGFVDATKVWHIIRTMSSC
jgi:ATP-dependent DNA helicase 2 subunit 2